MQVTPIPTEWDKSLIVFLIRKVPNWPKRIWVAAVIRAGWIFEMPRKGTIVFPLIFLLHRGRVFLGFGLHTTNAIKSYQMGIWRVWRPGEHLTPPIVYFESFICGSHYCAAGDGCYLECCSYVLMWNLCECQVFPTEPCILKGWA